MWDQVTTTPWDNAITRAMARADETWREFEVWGVRDNRARLLALVHHLHEISPDLTFVILPRKRIANWLEMSEKTTGRMIRSMEKEGLIRINRNVDGRGREWCFTGKQAREAALVGLGEEAALTAVGPVPEAVEWTLDTWEIEVEADLPPPAGEAELDDLLVAVVPAPPPPPEWVAERTEVDPREEDLLVLIESVYGH
jgi:DNA-binding MarR family transcriptional regulator